MISAEKHSSVFSCQMEPIVYVSASTHQLSLPTLKLVDNDRQARKIILIGKLITGAGPHLHQKKSVCIVVVAIKKKQYFI